MFRRPGRASVLVALLWCLALLSILVVGLLHTARLGLAVQKNYGDRIQAYYLALAGVEKAEALLYHDVLDRQRSGKNYTGNLSNDPEDFRDVTLGRGQFRVFRYGGPDEAEQIVYGVSDEESRLNVNQASVEELAKLPRMTADIAASILDWRDADDVRRPGGAEVGYYAGLQPPCQPRNAPFETIRELLMVKGVTPELLLGRPGPVGGTPEGFGGETSGSFGPSSSTGEAEGGWARVLTVDSSIENVDAAGKDRINVQSADESDLESVPEITSQIAKAIVAYRGQHRFQSLGDLLDVTAPSNRSRRASPASSNQPFVVSGQTPSGPPPSPLPGQSGNAAAGPKVISEELLMKVADHLTAASGQEVAGPVNINTAGAEVLACLPGIDRQLAQAIVAYRRSSGFFPNIAWLLRVPDLNEQIFKQVAPKVCARSETFRILGEGSVRSTGARERLEVIVHVDADGVQTLSYREVL